MMFSNAFLRTVVLSRVGDFLSGGWTRGGDSPPPYKTVDTTTMDDVSGSKTDTSNERFDQNFVDTNTKPFDGQGHVSGTRQPGDAGDANTHESPVWDEYKQAHQQKWQRQKDAEARDKLLGKQTAGPVNAKDVEPFSSRVLEENADALATAKGVKGERTPPLKIKDMAKVAGITTAITVPLTVVLTFGANIVLEVVKPLVNPPATPATEQSVREGRQVDHVQKSVFLLAHSLAVLRSEPFPGPSVEWMSKTNEERMDYLERILDYLEPEFVTEASQRGIEFQAVSTGEPPDDIKSRTKSLESRMAALSTLLADINKADA